MEVVARSMPRLGGGSKLATSTSRTRLAADADAAADYLREPVGLGQLMGRQHIVASTVFFYNFITRRRLDERSQKPTDRPTEPTNKPTSRRGTLGQSRGSVEFELKSAVNKKKTKKTSRRRMNHHQAGDEDEWAGGCLPRSDAEIRPK